MTHLAPATLLSRLAPTFCSRLPALAPPWPRRAVLVAAGLLAAFAALATPAPVPAALFDLAGSSLSENTDVGRFGRKNLTFDVDTRIGWDDNTLDRPDRVDFFTIDPVTGQRRRTGTQKKSGSIFVDPNGGVSYAAATSRFSLTFDLQGGVTYYFNRPTTRSYDPHVSLNVAFNYRLTPRATLDIFSNNLYQSESDPAVVGIQERRNGDYFYASERFSLSYRWTDRFSTVTSYSPVFVVYFQHPYSDVNNRTEQYFDQEFRFLVLPRLTLVAEYRFGYVSYFNSGAGVNAPILGINGLFNQTQIPGGGNDSYSNYFLLGFDFSIGPRSRVSFRGGAEVRDYAQSRIPVGFSNTVPGQVLYSNPSTQVSPYFETTFSYALAPRSSIAATLRYGIEESGVGVGDLTRRTFRIGFDYTQALTARISGYLSFYYTNNDYSFSSGGGSSFSEDFFEVSTGLRYQINRGVSVELGYTHVTLSSGVVNTNPLVVYDGSPGDYTRNRVYAGGRITF